MSLDLTYQVQEQATDWTSRGGWWIIKSFLTNVFFLLPILYSFNDNGGVEVEEPTGVAMNAKAQRKNKNPLWILNV